MYYLVVWGIDRYLFQALHKVRAYHIRGNVLVTHDEQPQELLPVGKGHHPALCQAIVLKAVYQHIKLFVGAAFLICRPRVAHVHSKHNRAVGHLVLTVVPLRYYIELPPLQRVPESGVKFIADEKTAEFFRKLHKPRLSFR